MGNQKQQPFDKIGLAQGVKPQQWLLTHAPRPHEKQQNAEHKNGGVFFQGTEVEGTKPGKTDKRTWPPASTETRQWSSASPTPQTSGQSMNSIVQWGINQPIDYKRNKQTTSNKRDQECQYWMMSPGSQFGKKPESRTKSVEDVKSSVNGQYTK